MLTDTQALGYVILAAQSLRLSEDEISKLVNQIKQEIEVWTEVVADEIYENWSE